MSRASFVRRGSLSLLAVLATTLLLASCVDAPSGPEGTGPGAFVIAPVLSLVGPGGERPMTSAQEDALAAAFDQVDRFRMVVRRAADNVVVLDTVIVVTPGQSEYDLTVAISAKDNEQFLVTLTAMQGTTVLFTAENIPATAAPAGVPGSAPPAAVQIPLVYTGPGATATSVTVGPAQVLLAPGGSATVGASVKDAGGAVVAGVPLAWATSASGVATVTASGVVTASGEGVATVTATTPTGLAASATVYVVGGELAYVEGGILKVRGVAAGTPTDRATGGASQPSWSPDGSKLYYVSGGQVWRAEGPPLSTGSWPSVSPDGTKLAVERGGQVWFVNDDGSEATQGPGGTSPVWADASTLLVGGGSVQRVKADGTGRTTVVEGGATLPALAGDGRIASVAAGELHVTGVSRALLTGATGRPTWSPSGRWLVVATASGLVLVPSDGSAEGVALPGLAGASDPAFKRTGSMAPVPSVSVAGFNPDPPIPGTQVQVLGSGFDWIIRTNNRVIWPTRDGAVESAVGVVVEGSITTTMPRNVIAGQVRVETRASSGMLAFVPTLGSLEVTARTPWGGGRGGVEVALAGPSGPASGTTDVNGSLVLPGLIPGTYVATITAPTGWELVGEGVRTLVIGAEMFALTLELTPVIASVALSPAAPELAVGSTLGVTLVVTGADGQSVPQVQGLVWRSLSDELVVTGGTGLGATLSATFSGEAAGSSVLEASFGGTSWTFPVTVTSSISGAITQETGATPAPPAPDVVVQVKKGGVVVAEARTGADGRYTVAGLFRGTYDAVPQPAADLLPVPAGQTVILDALNPTGRADFTMQSFAGLDVTARTPWDTPVAGVEVKILAADSAEIAKGTTDGEGMLSLTRLAAGSYTLKISAPAGFTLTGDASRSLTLVPGAQTLTLEVTPLIQSVVTIPENLSIEVGSVLDVELVASDINGNLVPQVSTAGWFTGSAGLAAAGVGFKGQVAGAYPSPADAPFDLAVELDSRIFTFPVKVTSYIQGTVTKDPEPLPAPVPGGEGPQTVTTATEPASGVTVTVSLLEGASVGTAVTDGAGHYRLGGLAQGTYEVLAAGQADLSPVPVAHTVVLDANHPTGTADFQMSRGAVDSILVTVSPDSLPALGATAQVTVQAFDTAGAPMGGRTTTYVSSDPAVATVDAAGKVTAVANGSTWIRTTVESKVDSVLVSVDQKAANLVLLDPKTGLPADSVQGFVADTGTVGYEARDANGNVIPPEHRTPTFTTSDSTVATVNATTGFVTLVTVGTADVTGTMDGASDVMKFRVLGVYEGDLSISSTTDITDVVQANLIGRVNGNLYIVETNLTNVDGLETILDVMGGVFIEYNHSLTNLNGLANLRYVGGPVYFSDNPFLSSTAIFPALSEIPGELIVDAGAKIFGMPALQAVGTSVTVGGGEGTNTVLQEFHLPALLSAGSVTIYGNHALTTVDMPLLEETTGGYGEGLAPPAPTSARAFVPDLPDGRRVLTDRTAARRLRTEAAEAQRAERRAEAEARRAEAEASREGQRSRSRALSQAPVVHGMQLDLPGSGADVQRQDLLARRAAQRDEARPARPKNPKPARPVTPQRNGYAGYGEFIVEDNPVLVGSSFPALRYVSGPLSVWENDLVAAVGFPLLETVGGSFYVANMLSMTSLTAPLLWSVGEDLDVTDNNGLGQLVLPALRSVGSDVWVGYNAAMTRLDLPVLETTGGYLNIYDHAALSVVEIATASTLEIGDALYFEYNYGLTSVQIPGLTYVEGDVEIYDNVINGSVVIGSAGALELGYDLRLAYNEGDFTFSAPGLIWVYDDIYVDYNPGLTSFTAATTGGPASVDYGVYFYDNPMLTTLVMPNVTTVDDYVEIYNNPALQSFNMAGLTSTYSLCLGGNGSPEHPLTFAFPALESLDGDLDLYGNYYGEGVAGLNGPQPTSGYSDGVVALLLPSLTYVGDDIWIDYNEILTTLDLSSLGWVSDYFEVYANDALVTFSVPALTWTGGDFFVGCNANLENFSAPALESTAGPIESLEAAPSGPPAAPTPISGGEVWVSYNGALTGFDLSSLGKTMRVYVEGNPQLVTLPSLTSLWPGAGVRIYGNGLTNLAGLAGVEELNELSIDGTMALTDLTGVASLKRAVYVFFDYNSGLTSLSMPGLERVWGKLGVTNHANLTSASFDNLATVGEDAGPSSEVFLTMYDNPQMASATFPQLATLHGQLYLYSNGLLNLNGFSALRSPVYTVQVYTNPALTDVMGLAGIGTTFANPAVAGSFGIYSNPVLCSDRVNDLISVIDARNPGAAFATTPVNSGNTGVCPSEQED